MGKKTGFGKLLTAVGINEEKQESFMKKAEEIQEKAGKTIIPVGDKILSNAADAIEIGKPWAKIAYEKAGDSLEKAGKVAKDFTENTAKNMASEPETTKEEEKVKATNLEFSGQPIRTKKETQLINQLLGSLNFAVQSLSKFTTPIIVETMDVMKETKEKLEDPNLSFEQITKVVLNALDKIQPNLESITFGEPENQEIVDKILAFIPTIKDAIAENQK